MAAVAILFSESDNASPLFTSELTSTTTTTTNLYWNLQENLAPLLPSPVLHFSYQGSLTFPYCNENVNWYVVHNPLDITHD